MQVEVDCEDIVLSQKKQQVFSGGAISQVIIYNDDYTPMEFVVDAVRTVFDLDEESASALTMRVHYEGKALCGIYPETEANKRACRLVELAQRNGHPLLCESRRI